MKPKMARKKKCIHRDEQGHCKIGVTDEEAIEIYITQEEVGGYEE